MLHGLLQNRSRGGGRPMKEPRMQVGDNPQRAGTIADAQVKVNEQDARRGAPRDAERPFVAIASN